MLRGLLRHPDSGARLAACEDLLHLGRAQDECWDSLGPKDRQSLKRFWNMIPPQQSWSENRGFEKDAHRWWDNMAASDNPEPSSYVIDELRLFTTINNSALRREFCVAGSSGSFRWIEITVARRIGRRRRLLSLKTATSSVGW